MLRLIHQLLTGVDKIVNIFKLQYVKIDTVFYDVFFN